MNLFTEMTLTLNNGIIKGKWRYKMSVHKEISKHSMKQHQRVVQFTQLDSEREQAIDKAVLQMKETGTCSVDEINRITKQINELAKQGIVPMRKLVSVEMVKEYVERLKVQ